MGLCEFRKKGEGSITTVACSARARTTFHVILGSVADPRLFLQATAHPERFIHVPTFLAGLSSLTLTILAWMNSGHMGYWLSGVCDISYTERTLLTSR